LTILSCWSLAHLSIIACKAAMPTTAAYSP
jgi:hypothetical protein